jgi:hypothetical protein
MICRFTTKSFIGIPPCQRMVTFVTEFVTLFFVVNPFIRKQLSHGGISKYFVLDHFASSFLGRKYYFQVNIPF